MSFPRKVGIELEFSDVLTVKAAEELYKLWGRDFSTWEDRWGAYSKPRISYDEWNCMSDGSLKNSDGSRCMWSVFDDLKGRPVSVSASKDSPDRKRWSGIEVVSPATKDDLRLYRELSDVVKTLHGMGATTLPKHWNSLHVHVDLQGIPWETVAGFVRPIFEIQKDIDRLSTKWRRRSFFEEWQVEALESPEALRSKEDWFKTYRTVTTRKGVRIVSPQDDRQRRLIDVGPFFTAEKPYNTMEFRCFRSYTYPEPIIDQIQFAVKVAEDLIWGRDLKEWVPDWVEKFFSEGIQEYA